MLTESFWHDENRVRCLNQSCYCEQESQAELQKTQKIQKEYLYRDIPDQFSDVHTQHSLWVYPT